MLACGSLHCAAQKTTWALHGSLQRAFCPDLTQAQGTLGTSFKALPVFTNRLKYGQEEVFSQLLLTNESLTVFTENVYPRKGAAGDSPSATAHVYTGEGSDALTRVLLRPIS